MGAARECAAGQPVYISLAKEAQPFRYSVDQARDREMGRIVQARPGASWPVRTGSAAFAVTIAIPRQAAITISTTTGAKKK
jgi:hypothetical protein